MLGNSGSGLGAIRRIRYTGTAPTPPAGSLLAPFASPAVGSATLPFTLVRPARVSLTLYDIAGRPVRTLIAGEARNALRDFPREAILNAGPGVFRTGQRNFQCQEVMRIESELDAVERGKAAYQQYRSA